MALDQLSELRGQCTFLSFFFQPRLCAHAFLSFPWLRLTTDQLEGRTRGRAFNSSSGRVNISHLRRYVAKRSNLKVNTRLRTTLLLPPARYSATPRDAAAAVVVVVAADEDRGRAAISVSQQGSMADDRYAKKWVDPTSERGDLLFDSGGGGRGHWTESQHKEEMGSREFVNFLILLKPNC